MPALNRLIFCFYQIGTWLSPVEHSAGGRGVAGSNPVVPTLKRTLASSWRPFFHLMGVIMPFYAYMIKSESTGKHYYGHTSDLDERMENHNSTQNKYTRSKGSRKLVGYLEAETKGEAMKLENKLMKMKNPKRAKVWLERLSSVR